MCSIASRPSSTPPVGTDDDAVRVVVGGEGRGVVRAPGSLAAAEEGEDLVARHEHEPEPTDRPNGPAQARATRLI